MRHAAVSLTISRPDRTTRASTSGSRAKCASITTWRTTTSAASRSRTRPACGSTNNVATGNTGGILSFTLPFLDVKTNSENRIDHNRVQGNNRPNTCIDPEDAVCGVPQGTGILALAVDANQVDHNLVLGNDSYGIAVANFCLGSGLTPEQCAALDIDPDPDENRVAHNAVFGNGAHPSPLIAPVFAVDLAWDLSGSGNCWAKNAFDTRFPEDLPGCD